MQNNFLMEKLHKLNTKLQILASAFSFNAFKCLYDGREVVRIKAKAQRE